MKTPVKKSWHDNLPFQKHWRSYVALKLILLVVAVYLLLKMSGML